MSVPSNLLPTPISALPEYGGSSALGYLPYVYQGVTYKVQLQNVISTSQVPPTRTIATGTGLTGGGNLTADRTISIANGGVGTAQLAASGATAGVYGDGANVPVVTVDITGRVTSITTTAITLTGFVPTTRTVTAGTGLLGGGNLASNITLSANLSNATPLALGAASAGTATNISRSDHVHPAVNLSDGAQTQGVLPLGRGGTSASLSPVAGAVVYSTGTELAMTNVGLAGQVLVSNGAGAPVWMTEPNGLIVGSTTITGGVNGRVLYDNAGVVGEIALSSIGVTSFSAGTTGLTPNSATTGVVTLAGTLAVSNGGTGQTTAGAAFNALSPITTTGDLIIGTGVNTASRLGIGGNGTVLTSNGTTASWVALSSEGVTSWGGGTTGLTPSAATTGIVTLAGVLNVLNGGTGVTTSTGSGSVVLATSPTLVTPALGTPSSGTLTSCTGLPISTGVSGLAAGIATFLATPSSANLGTALTDKTGTGVNVFATSPSLVTPALGVATATTLAIGGATIGSNALAVTGSSSLNGLTFSTTNTYDIGTSTTVGAPRNIYAGTNILAGGSVFVAGSKIASPSDGVFTLTNNAGTNVSLLQIGGTSSSFPAMGPNGGQLWLRLADNSDYAAIKAKKYVAPFGTTLTDYSDGNCNLTNAAGTSCGLLGIGPATSSFPAIGPSGGQLWVRAGDNSGYASVRAAGYIFTNGSTLIDIGGGNLQQGGADIAAPLPQSIQVYSVVAGTSNTAGAQFTIAGSRGTGTGAGGSILFQVAPAGSTGTAQNALATALTIDSTKTATFAAGITTGSTTLHTTSVALTNGAAAQVATMTNGPRAGNPTKWIPINDNGTTRYIPCW